MSMAAKLCIPDCSPTRLLDIELESDTCILDSVNELKGRVALVTGSSRGIGRAVAIALAEAGVDIVLNFLRRSVEAQAVDLQIRQFERRCVNNAGIGRPQPIEEIMERDCLFLPDQLMQC
jgi:hypothetical protein